MTKRQQKISNLGVVIWITGLSGSGKSTLADSLTNLLRQAGKTVVMLDGDLLREVLGANSPANPEYDRVSRLELALKYANICKMIASQGFIVVIATISLFKEVHIWNRKNFPAYFEVYLKVSLEELRRRDPKEIYKQFDAGNLTNVAGLDLCIDEPEAPDLLIQSDERGVTSSWAKAIVHNMKKRKLL